MCRTREAQIKCAATKAKDLLGQLGPLVWALHSRHDCVALAAAALAEDPEAHVRIRVPDPEGRIRKQTVDDIQALTAGMDRYQRPDLFSSGGLRDVINRSIVVYAVAVLEQFLDEAGKKLWECALARKRATKRECGNGDPRWPRSLTGMLAQLKTHVVSLESCTGYPQCALLAQVRHLVVHKDGRIDAEFRRKVAPLGPGYRKSRDSDSIVYDPAAQDPVQCAWVGRPFAIPIDEFILPRLRDAQAFVQEASQELSKAVGRCPQ